MRPAFRLAACLALATAALPTLISVAEAQNRRPLRVIVQKRSYFDAGKVVPVGSMNRYATQHAYATPVYASFGSFYGEDTLPGRIGAGANPFRDSFWTPRGY